VCDPFSCTKEEALGKFSSALLSVAAEYFSVPLPDGTEGYQERVFAYELYHQLRNHFSANWYVNGEFRKGLSMVPRIGSDRQVIPDIVIHQSNTIDRNLLVVEIKTNRNTSPQNLLDDLRKLEMYTHPREGLGFSIGIMLAVNFNAEATIAGATPQMRDDIARCMEQGPRTAIWNIEKPVPVTFGNDGDGRLDHSCLKILRADDVTRLCRR
jgi:hypothetical protein